MSKDTKKIEIAEGTDANKQSFTQTISKNGGAGLQDLTPDDLPEGAGENPYPENPPKKQVSQVLIELAQKKFRLFIDADDNPFAVTEGSCYVQYIDSGQFKDELSDLLYQEKKKAPSGEQLSEACRVLRAKARQSGKKEVNVRVASAGSELYINTGVDAIIQVTANGVKTCDQSEAPFFLQSKGVQMLPVQKGSGNIKLLKKHLNCSNEQDFWLSVAWLLTALRPDIQCPILVLQGEQGTGKTTEAKMLRQLVDPNTNEIAMYPRKPEDVQVACRYHRVVSYDNLSGISREIADTLCSVVTGGGISFRQLYTTADECSFSVMRAIICNGIDEIATRPDLASRSTIMRKQPIPKSDRKTETEVWSGFDRDKDEIFTALLMAMQYGLAKPVTMKNPPRMADFANWSASCLQYFGVQPETFAGHITDNENRATEITLDSDLVAQAILKLVPEPGEQWEGTANQLRHEIKEQTPDATMREIPKGKGLYNRLNRIAPALRTEAISWQKLHKRTERVIFIKRETNEKP